VDYHLTEFITAAGSPSKSGTKTCLILHHKR